MAPMFCMNMLDLRVRHYPVLSLHLSYFNHFNYQRNTGNAFGKYAPIIKDVTFDVYNEFKEFLEENRELELLAKQVMIQTHVLLIAVIISTASNTHFGI